MRAHIEIDRGAGPAVLMLHGQPGTARDWRAVVDALPESARVIVPDRAGYGTADPEALGIAGNAEDVLALMDASGIASATIVAHSWAGAVALYLAEHARERIDALVLAASVGPGSITPLDRLLAARGLGETLAWGGTHLIRRFLARDRGHALVAGRFGTEAAETFRSTLRGRAWRSFVVEQRAMVAELPSVVARLGDVRAPAVVVAGDLDRLVSMRTARALADGIPTARLVVVRGVGHAQAFEAPAVLAREIASVVPTEGARS